MTSRLLGSVLSKICIYYVFVMCILQSLGFPRKISFFFDLISLLLLALVVIDIRAVEQIKNPMVLLQVLFYVFGITVAFLYRVRLLLILWAARNQMRFLLFLIACILFLTVNDIQRILRVFDFLFLLNFVVYIAQFIFWGLSGDQLGGIFGTIEGCNGYSNVFLVGMTSYYASQWFYKKLSTFRFLVYLSMAIGQAALGEIKAFFVELVIIFGILLIRMIDREYGASKRKFKDVCRIALPVVVFILIGTWVVGEIRPDFKGFFSVARMWKIATAPEGYSWDLESVNRLNAISVINDNVFTNGAEKVFGLGLGSSEYSESFDKICSDFYKENANLKYWNFMHSWIYIENGFLGLFLFIGSLVAGIAYGIKHLRISDFVEDKINKLTGVLFTICTLFMVICNTSLRVYSGFLAYFFISMMFITGNTVRNKYEKCDASVNFRKLWRN